ncbi:3'-5' exoribonuclease YhaM family protein [Lignipirellula cremea]|uniref:3'-5' exoribonuclease YhaM n=1 Tax=Lignipirellula cremea TaxID=2528010 RepID=A0A518DVI7_9BACT|nr:HD domain-containing protein [Lignipirellula cremea]QDU95852.1 3'-5' exoribonuclease YhaM [Lignipirellula cremea]
MPGKKILPILTLSEMTDGQEADAFVMLAAKEELVTKTGKPYYRVTFRDAGKSLTFPIWNDSLCAEDCRGWSVGQFFKVRSVYRESTYGPQLEIHKVREACDADRADGFDEWMCRPRSQFEPEEMFAALLAIASDQIADGPLSELVTAILTEHRERLLTMPAAVRNHHAFAGGYLEHVLSVTRNALMLADKYRTDYPDLQPALSRDLVAAGAILHDIGKLQELEQTPAGARYSPAGELIGHILLGRDMVREAAVGRGLDQELQLRLEHMIVSHQRLPEWGSPKPPMTPEALIVHFADDLDASFQMMYAALAEDGTANPMTPTNKALRSKVFKGLGSAAEQ